MKPKVTITYFLRPGVSLFSSESEATKHFNDTGKPSLWRIHRGQHKGKIKTIDKPDETTPIARLIKRLSNKDLANKIADRLFSSLFGQGTRLEIKRLNSNRPEEALGGWSRDAAVKQIVEALDENERHTTPKRSQSRKATTHKSLIANPS